MVEGILLDDNSVSDEHVKCFLNVMLSWEWWDVVTVPECTFCVAYCNSYLSFVKDGVWTISKLKNEGPTISTDMLLVTTWRFHFNEFIIHYAIVTGCITNNASVPGHFAHIAIVTGLITHYTSVTGNITHNAIVTVLPIMHLFQAVLTIMSMFQAILPMLPC